MFPPRKGCPTSYSNYGTKARIFVLGNHEDRIWTKSDKYALVLCPDTLRLLVSMAVKCRCTLKQGDCKNAFCQGILPPDKITIVEPPIGDPDAKDGKYWLLKQKLYGLCRSPKHWYDKSGRFFTSSLYSKMPTALASSAVTSLILQTLSIPH